MRDSKRLIAIRKLPCVRCGWDAPSEAAHSNFSEHGKGRGIKAADQYTIPLCRLCHAWFDGYVHLTREQSKDWFKRMLDKTNRMLSLESKEVF